MLPNALPGDVLLTYGEARLWPPKYLIRAPLYHAIREYQKRAYAQLRDTMPQLEIPETISYRATHAYLYVGYNWLFEFTMPRAQFVRVAESRIIEKGYTLCRHTSILFPEPSKILLRCKAFEGSTYDIGDLLDFQVSGWLNILKPFRVFGDRAKEMAVCSTGLIEVMKIWGVKSEVPAAPAWFENVRRDWRIIDSRIGA